MKTRQISRNGYVYKIAYGLNEKSHVEKVTRCRLYLRCILMGCFAWPAAFIFVAFVQSFATIFGFFFARRPKTYEERELSSTDDLTIPYTKWPVVRGKRVYPIWFMLAALFAYFIPTISTFLVDIITSPTLWYAIGAVTSLIFFAFLFKMVRNTTWFSTAKRHVRGWREHTCVTVTFID